MASTVRIDEVGFSKFTGDIGGIEFVNGVSVGELSGNDVARLAASMRIKEVTHEDENGEVIGKQLGIASDLARGVGVAANVKQRETIPANELVPVGVDPSAISPAIVDEDGNEYTREMLEAIADKFGISGVRKVAEKFDVKSNSIVGLIAGIMKTIEG